MINVRINASAEYEVLIGEGLLADAGMYINRDIPGAKTLAVISDSNVYPIYGARVEYILQCLRQKQKKLKFHLNLRKKSKK